MVLLSATVKTSQAIYKQHTAVDEEDVFLGYEMHTRSDDPYDHPQQRMNSGRLHSEDLRSEEGGYYDERSAGLSGKLHEVYVLFSQHMCRYAPISVFLWAVL